MLIPGSPHPMFMAAGNEAVLQINPYATWVTRSVAAFNNRSIVALAYSPQNNTVVGVGTGGFSGGVGGIYSQDGGITWGTTPVVDNLKYFEDVEWAPELGIFVAVSRNNNNKTTMYSTDGITWTQGGLLDPPIGWKSLAWSSSLNRFAVVSMYQPGFTQSATSPNGVVWTSATNPGVQLRWHSLAWSPTLELFVAVGLANNDTGVYNVATSVNGVDWIFRGLLGQAGCTVQKVIWIPELSKFMAVAGGFLTPTNKLFMSYDGINWTSHPGPASGTARSIAYAPGFGLFIGDTAGAIYYSGDLGETWSLNINYGSAQSWSDIIWVPSTKMFVACSSNNPPANTIRTYSPFY